jgi:hypothetical protein
MPPRCAGRSRSTTCPHRAPAITSVDDLAGREVFVRKSTSYYRSLLELNERLKAAGKAPVSIHETPENLEDDDLPA